MRRYVTAIGTRFEFHRAGFNPDLLADTEAGLTRLYEVTGTAPVGPRRSHDGVSPITVTASGWAEQQLWDLLVPAAGATVTVQGEVVRVTGRLARELRTTAGSTGTAGSARWPTPCPAT